MNSLRLKHLGWSWRRHSWTSRSGSELNDRNRQRAVVLCLYVDPTDVGFVIGPQDCMAKSLPLFVGTARNKWQWRALLEIMNRPGSEAVQPSHTCASSPGLPT